MYFSKLNALLWIAELQSFLRLLKNILQAPQEEEPLFSLPADLTIFPSHHIFYPPVLRSTTLMDIKWKKEIANNLTVKQSEFKEAFEMSNNFRTAVCVIHILDISQISALYQFMNRHFYDNVQIFSPLVVILYFHQIYFVSLQIFAINADFYSNQRHTAFYCTRSSKILFENQNSIEKNCWNICERIRRICRPSIISRRVGDISIFHPKERRSQDKAWTSYWHIVIRMIMIYTTL